MTTSNKPDVDKQIMKSIEVEMFRWSGTRSTQEKIRKVVYETEVNGVRTLDLYSGWAVEGEEHKFKIQSVPMNLSSFIHLERLWISHNNLSDLPMQMNQLKNLKQLFLHYNAFVSVPQCIFEMSSLEMLWMSSNELKEIPPEISKLRSLRQVHFEHNNLEHFQEALCDLPSLEVLYLNHNQLVSISANISQVANTLRRLYLNHNKIAMIPETICTLQKLELLYLHNNNISSVPSKFESFCTSLKEKNKAIIQVNNNPYVLPKPRVKLSVGGPPPTLQVHANPSRRYSDDYRQRSLTQPSSGSSGEHGRYSVPSAVESVAPNRERPGSGRKSATLHR